MRLELNIYREGNNIIGNYYRITAWKGSSYLGERVYAGYTRKESIRLARERVKERGELFSY